MLNDQNVEDEIFILKLSKDLRAASSTMNRNEATYLLGQYRDWSAS